MTALPFNYHIEVYENSFMSDPVWHAEATNPFPAISIGDRFNHRGLGNVAWYPLKKWSMLPDQGDRAYFLDH